MQTNTVICDPGSVMLNPGDWVEHISVIIQGIGSFLSIAENGESIEAAPFGPGDAIGLGDLGAGEGSQFQVKLLTQSQMFHIAIDDVRRILGGELNNLREYYLHTLLTRMAQSLLCRSYHRPAQRVARRLLLMRHHTESRHINITHEGLANIMGVRRNVVTDAVTYLEKKSAIINARCQIIIMDLRKLKSAACAW